MKIKNFPIYFSFLPSPCLPNPLQTKTPWGKAHRIKNRNSKVREASCCGGDWEGCGWCCVLGGEGVGRWFALGGMVVEVVFLFVFWYADQPRDIQERMEKIRTNTNCCKEMEDKP